MSIVTWPLVFVGLDYHMSFVQVCVMDPDGKMLLNRKCANTGGRWWRRCMTGLAKRFACRRRLNRAVERPIWRTS